MLKKEKKMKKKKEKEEEEFQLPEEKDLPASTPHVKVNVDSGSKDLRELLEKNIKWSQVIYEQNRKIKRKLTWMSVGSYIRLAIIVVPIVLGIIYLPPLIEGMLDQYSSALGIDFGGLDIQELLGQLEAK